MKYVFHEQEINNIKVWNDSQCHILYIIDFCRYNVLEVSWDIETDDLCALLVCASVSTSQDIPRICACPWVWLWWQTIYKVLRLSWDVDSDDLCVSLYDWLQTYGNRFFLGYWDWLFVCTLVCDWCRPKVPWLFWDEEFFTSQDSYSTVYYVCHHSHTHRGIQKSEITTSQENRSTLGFTSESYTLAHTSHNKVWNDSHCRILYIIVFFFQI